jgi:hypothetical protein
MITTVKRIPYGIADYGRMKRDTMYYVDKTHYIPQIEAASYYLFFIRPHRFGKTLWLSVLQHYYDVNQEAQFEALFGDTYIGTHPTPDRNAYLVMMFNFAVVDPDARRVQQSFEQHGLAVLEDFLSRYAHYFDETESAAIMERPTTADRLQALFYHVARKELHIYLLIDEYDNFANTILTTQGETAYRDLTHGGGFFRYFFNLLKGATSGAMSGIARMFITGVSPITMDDVTSGFNIGDNICLDPAFNAALGLTEAETRALLEHYHTNAQFPLAVEPALETMRAWYGGYRFATQAAECIFNTDMVWYFIKQVTRYGGLPEQLLDMNVRTDYNKLRHLLVVDRRLNGNFSRLREIIEAGETAALVAESFPLERLTSTQNFTSLLFYMGLLTFDGMRGSLPVLRIPNLTIRELLYGYLRDGYHDTNIFRINPGRLADLVNRMAHKGEWQPFFDFLAEQIAAQTSVRDYLGGEKVIQGFLLAYLNVTNFFLTWSEREMGGGFSDIYLEPFLANYPAMQYGYLIELKYLPRSEDKAARLPGLIAEAETQLRRYLTDARVQAIAERVTLIGAVLVYHGWELVYRGAM